MTCGYRMRTDHSQSLQTIPQGMFQGADLLGFPEADWQGWRLGGWEGCCCCCWFWFLLRDRVSPVPGHSGSLGFIAKDDLEFLILLPHFLSAGVPGMHYCTLLSLLSMVLGIEPRAGQAFYSLSHIPRIWN